jgi:hypothetical protein
VVAREVAIGSCRLASWTAYRAYVGGSSLAGRKPGDSRSLPAQNVGKFPADVNGLLITMVLWSVFGVGSSRPRIAP